MKILGHPLHMMLIHFPSALFPMDFIFALIFIYTGNSAFAETSFYTMCAGVILGWLAFITGCLDLITVMKENNSALKSALIHGGINTTILIGYSLLAYKYYLHPSDIHSIGTGGLIFRGILVATLLGGNYIGANLVLKHRIAVEKING
jgi:uncharacterized membrane protein